MHLPNIAEIRAARARLGDLVLTTPVHNWSGREKTTLLGEETEVWLKLELFQYGGSFKPRGALTVMLDLTAEELSRGVTAVSAGNHAIAVAYAAQVLGTTAKVVMPQNANPARVRRCRDLGAEVVLVADVHAAFETVEQIQASEGRSFVHPFEGPKIVLGTATAGLELCEQIPEPDAAIIPVGGGGLAAGISQAVKSIYPRCRVFGVEPVGADSMSRSFLSGKPESIDRVATIADSLGAPFALPYSYAVCKKNIERMVQVEDEALCRGMALMYQEMKLAVEPAGAAALAALLGPLRDELSGKRVALIVCGANIDIDHFAEYVKRGMASAV